MSASVTDRFLSEIDKIIEAKDGQQLRNYLVIEPPYGNLYASMIVELRHQFSKGSETVLETRCTSYLAITHGSEEDLPWSAFVKFIVQYLIFLRDVDTNNLLNTYNSLSELVQKCNNALGHPTHGILMLPTVVVYSQILSRLAIGLDKKPELISRLARQSADEGEGRETLPERAANIVRQAFVTCLNDRPGAVAGQRDGQPQGKKIGIYKIANLCLKILFQCRKTRNAEQIFVNIYNQSPPLSLYPKSQRVTYLYYLGRFLFSNNHFYRAQLALQSAYEQCHTSSTTQRRIILVYLVSSNIILGRFPSQRLISRPEAKGFDILLTPICTAITKGDLVTLNRLLADDAEHVKWFRRYRILLQLRHRCEVLAWRSLARRVFLISGFQGDPASRKAPTFNLNDLLVALQYLCSGNAASSSTQGGTPGQRHTNWIFMHDNNKKANAYIDPDLDGTNDMAEGAIIPDMLEVESILTSLIDQGLLNGFISHRQLRFAIVGAKKKGAIAAGFPNVWQVMNAKADHEVPGWVKDPRHAARNRGHQRFGPGMVVNLSGARPVGVR